jgi:hypothetical protein
LAFKTKVLAGNGYFAKKFWQKIGHFQKVLAENQAFSKSFGRKMGS